MKILVVDDEINQIQTLCRGLLMLGHKVISAPNGEEALEKLSALGPVDLVITDFAMPGMSGLELFRKIRQIQEAVPVIIMTGYNSEDILHEALSEGIFSYLEKPFSLERLRDEINRVERQQSPESGGLAQAISN